MYSGLVGVVLLLLGHLYHLIRSADFSTYPQYNVRINAHLRVDAFLTLLGALVFLAFPDAAIRSLVRRARAGFSCACVCAWVLESRNCCTRFLSH